MTGVERLSVDERSVALWSLLVFYLAAAPHLQPIKPLSKFVMMKALIFVTYW